MKQHTPDQWVTLTLAQLHVVEEMKRALFCDSLPLELRHVKRDTLGMDEDDLIALVRARRAERAHRWQQWQFIHGDWS
jgi:hypothetical protein